MTAIAMPAMAVRRASGRKNDGEAFRLLLTSRFRSPVRINGELRRVRRSLGVGGLSGEFLPVGRQRVHDRINRVLGLHTHFLIGRVLDRVRYEHRPGGQVRHAERLGLGLGGMHELGRRHQDRGDSPRFVVD